MLQPIQEDPTLIRLELLGNLARAARLALNECEQADSVEFHVTATPDGMFIDCALLVNGQTIGGWGQ